jgi:hypothetical protein
MGPERQGTSCVERENVGFGFIKRMTVKPLWIQADIFPNLFLTGIKPFDNFTELNRRLDFWNWQR